jgi:hypothetical protein
MAVPAFTPIVFKVNRKRNGEAILRRRSKQCEKQEIPHACALKSISFARRSGRSYQGIVHRKEGRKRKD